MSSLADTRDGDGERRISFKCQGRCSGSEMWQCLLDQVTSAPDDCYSIGSHHCFGEAYLSSPFGRRRVPKQASSYLVQHHQKALQRRILLILTSLSYHTLPLQDSRATRATPPLRGLKVDPMESLGRGAYGPGFSLGEVFLATARRFVFAAIRKEGGPIAKACR